MLIGRRFFLAAVMLLVSLGVGRPLPSALGPIHRPGGRTFQEQGTRGETACVAFGSEAQGRSGLLEHGQHLMQPVVGVWLPQPTLQRVHRVQGIGLLIDQDKQ
jgi:hypothetical protein